MSGRTIMTHNDEPMERCPICARATNWTPEEYASHIAHGGDRPPVLLTDEELRVLADPTPGV